MLTRTLLLKMAVSPKMERIVRKNSLSSALARRFVAGETLQETVEPLRALNVRRITATLDYLGENVYTPQEADELVNTYFAIFRFIADNDLKSNVSVKLTALGLDISDELAYRNMRRILDEANGYGQFVRIDMEGSDYTERTLNLCYRLWQDYKNFGTVIQSYLYRSESDVNHLLEERIRIRLVKGAYKEPKEVAFQKKSQVDDNYIALMKQMMKRGDYPAIATHDRRIIRIAKEFASKESIEKHQFEFQMLFGIQREMQEALANEGYPVRIYVPYGTRWYGYMMRRLAERPANIWFVVKNLFRR